jgi:outer membrane biosynthesis protein TonB
MRVKSLAAAVGLSVVAAVTLGQGVSSANRGSSDDPVAQPQIELPAEPVEETPAPAPEVTPAVPPVEEETPAPPVVVEDPAPVTTTTTLPPAPAPARDPKPVKVPVVEPAPVVTLEKKKADPAPAPAKPEPAPKQADPCHMDSYEPRNVADLSGDERARADKVDRNDNGVVCRKDIPGKGRGNTGQNSNIKDDQVR